MVVRKFHVKKDERALLFYRGDFVDVLLSAEIEIFDGKGKKLEGRAAEMPDGDSLLKYSTETVMRNVKVLAIDQLLNERADQPTVATVAKAVTLQVTPEQAQKVLLAGNIGKLSLVLRQPGEGRATASRRMTDDDLGVGFTRREAPKVASAGPIPVPKAIERQENTKVTIFHGTDSKVYDVVREGD